ncbi:gag-pol polyprotein [Tanacetum coccineum]
MLLTLLDLYLRISSNLHKSSTSYFIQLPETKPIIKEKGWNIQSRNSGNTSTVQCYNCSGKGHYARNFLKPRVQDSNYFMEQMLLAKHDEAGRKIQPADNTSDAGPSYDSAFISEVQSSSIKDNQEQMYPTHTKIINSIIGDDQIDSNIIFDEPNGNVNSDSVEKDTHFLTYYALDQLARTA